MLFDFAAFVFEGEVPRGAEPGAPPEPPLARGDGVRQLARGVTLPSLRGSHQQHDGAGWDAVFDNPVNPFVEPLSKSERLVSSSDGTTATDCCGSKSGALPTIVRRSSFECCAR